MFYLPVYRVVRCEWVVIGHSCFAIHLIMIDDDEFSEWSKDRFAKRKTAKIHISDSKYLVKQMPCYASHNEDPFKHGHYN